MKTQMMKKPVSLTKTSTSMKPLKKRSCLKTLSPMKTTVKSKNSLSLAEVEHQLHRACDQLELLEERMKQLQQRIKHCRFPGARHSLQLQLQVLRGVYQAFYQFSQARADDIQQKCEQEMD